MRTDNTNYLSIYLPLCVAHEWTRTQAHYDGTRLLFSQPINFDYFFFSFNFHSQYGIWILLWIGWNTFLICFYLNVGILNRVSTRIHASKLCVLNQQQFETRFVAPVGAVVCRRLHKTREYCHHSTITAIFCHSHFLILFPLFRHHFPFPPCQPTPHRRRRKTGQWYFKFRNWRSIVVRSERLWLHANISDKHNIRGSISTGATRIRGRMPFGMVYRRNYTIGGAIMFGGNSHEYLISSKGSRI